MAFEHLNSRTAKEDYGSQVVDNETEDSESEECTIQEAIDKSGNGRFQIWIAVVCGIAWMNDALTMLLLTIMSVVLRCEWRLTIFQGSLITSLPFIGQMVGSYFWGQCADKYGRRVILAWTSFHIFWSSTLSVFSPNLTWFLVHRVFSTFMNGSLAQGITLLSEFMPNKHRGFFLSCFQISYSFGVILSVVVALVVIPTMGWRWYLFICALPNAIAVVLLGTIPVSPYYLLSIGKTDKALEVIKKVGQLNGKKPLSVTKLKRPDQQDRGSLKDLFSTPDLSKSSILLAIIWFSISISYTGVVLLTAETLSDGNACTEFNHDMSSSCADDCQPFSNEAYVNMIIVAMAEIPSVFISIALIDLLGRRALLFFGSLLYSLSFSLLLFCFKPQSVTTLILVASKCFSQVTFLTSFTYTPELYATPVRGLALGVGVAISRIGTVMSPMIAQILASYSVKGAIIILVVFGIIGAVASFLLPIETKGQPIQTSLSRRRPSTE